MRSKNVIADNDAAELALLSDPQALDVLFRGKLVGSISYRFLMGPLPAEDGLNVTRPMSDNFLPLLDKLYCYCLLFPIKGGGCPYFG